MAPLPPLDSKEGRAALVAGLTAAGADQGVRRGVGRGVCLLQSVEGVRWEHEASGRVWNARAPALPPHPDAAHVLGAGGGHQAVI